MKTIAFPAISCGAYGFPLEDACKIALDTIREFILNNDFLEKIIFIDINDIIVEIYKRQLYWYYIKILNLNVLLPLYLLYFINMPNSD